MFLVGKGERSFLAHSDLKKIAELGKISLAELLTPYRGIEEIHISILEKKLFRDFPSILNDYTEEEILLIKRGNCL